MSKIFDKVIIERELYNYGDDKETNVIKLITDLIHYCHANDIDFDQKLETARHLLITIDALWSGGLK
jgi:hypothetical protein